MKKLPIHKCTPIASAILAIFIPHHGFANPLPFSSLPPGQMAIPPAPDVVVSVDDSGSMGESMSGPDGNKTKIYYLKKALNDVFNDTLLLPDGKIRLAWQVMHNNGGASSAGNILAGNINSMKVLDAVHRNNFIIFANSLKASGGTPSHQMMRQVYNYMKTGLSTNSPWAYKPGVQGAPYLACRRAYHIFMTDGGWNGYSNADLPNASGVVTAQFPDGNVDNRNFTLPDGQAADGTPVPGQTYDTSSDQTYVYRGKSGNLDRLLADWAMKMWAEDLQPSIDNKITPSTTDGVPATETYGSVALQRYWNPKHNPATWQHLVTYTIGYGTDAYSWPGEPKWSTTDDDNYGAGGDYSKLVQGLASWKPTTFGNLNSGNPAELWHMAINSRGKFYPTGPGRKYDLAQAFRLILEDINLQNSADVASMAASSSTNIRTDLNKYTAGYDPKTWSGYVKSDTYTTTDTTAPDPVWGTTLGGKNLTTANKLDARSYTSRIILTMNDDTDKGVPFQWEAGTGKLSAAEKALLDSDGKGEDRLNFLRGDRSKEGGTATKPFRSRDSAQGDIINSNVWYVEQPSENYSLSGYSSFRNTYKDRFPMVYVGGNDGMLHGFSAINGEELIAYVPKGVYPRLANLSDPAYKHKYYVDGSPFSGDVDTSDKSGSNPANWRTYLVGALGAGGKGYFVLDITQPGSGSTASEFSNTNAENTVILDRSMDPSNPGVPASDDEDIGHIFSAPVMDDNNPYKTNQIARLNDKRWAVVMGNGYNSKNERPVLLIQYLDGATELKKIVATGTQAPHSPVDPVLDINVVGNGLSAPRLVDIDGNGTADVVYAGDIKGNLWKFDLTSNIASAWDVAIFNGTPNKPLFTATYSGQRQPISAPPSVRANDRGAGGMMVAFGTGLNVTDADRTNTDVQTVYSILDNTRYRYTGTAPNIRLEVDTSMTPQAISGTADLVEQEFDTAPSSGIAGSGTSAGRRFWKMKNKPVDFTDPSSPKKGWFFNMQVSGERILQSMQFFDRSNNLMVWSTTPAYGGTGGNEESCEPAGTPATAYLTLMNIMDGRKPSVPVMDVNGDGLFVAGPAGDKDVSRVTIQPGASSSVVGKKTIKLTGSDGGSLDLARMPEQPMRPSWRQLQ